MNYVIIDKKTNKSIFNHSSGFIRSTIRAEKILAELLATKWKHRTRDEFDIIVDPTSIEGK